MSDASGERVSPSDVGRGGQTFQEKLRDSLHRLQAAQEIAATMNPDDFDRLLRRGEDIHKTLMSMDQRQSRMQEMAGHAGSDLALGPLGGLMRDEGSALLRASLGGLQAVGGESVRKTVSLLQGANSIDDSGRRMVAEFQAGNYRDAAADGVAFVGEIATSWVPKETAE